MKCEWKNVKLSEITSLITKGTTPTSIGYSFVEQGVNFIKSESITTSRRLDKNKYCHISEITHEKLKRSQLQANDILFSMAGMFLGKTAIVTKDDLPANTNQAVAIIRIIPELADVKYIYYYLNQKQIIFYINSAIGQSAQPNINLKQIGNLDIKLPDLETQRKISSILDCIDDKIELNNKINANLQQQAEAIFKSWFVDFEPFGGEKPQDWKISELGSCCSLISRGIAPKYDDISDEIVLNQKCIRDQQIDLTKARNHLPKKRNEKWLKHGDILINSTGQGTLGRIAQVHFQPEKMTVDSHITIVRPESDFLKYYLGCLLTGREYEFSEMARGSTGQTELPRDSVQKYEIVLPTSDILEKFNALVCPMFSCLVKNQEENLQLAELRDALLPKLMNGEILLGEK